MEYQKYRDLPNRLLKVRKSLNLTQEQVAATLGLKNKTLISRWERGRSIPTLITAVRLSVIYQISLDTLFSGLLDFVNEEYKNPMLKLDSEIQGIQTHFQQSQEISKT